MTFFLIVGTKLTYADNDGFEYDYCGKESYQKYGTLTCNNCDYML